MSHSRFESIGAYLPSGLRDTAPHILGAYAPESLKVPAKPTAGQIEKLVDPVGFNLAFKDTENLSDYA